MRWLALLAIVALAVAGCSTPQRPSPGSGFPAQHVEKEVPQTANFTGLQVRGIVEGAGAFLTLHASAFNAGPRTYDVETGCSQPWHELLLHGSEQVPMREPMYTCQAFALRDFPPGETVWYNLSWNGTLWDEESRRFVPADAGDYEWAVQFVAYRQDTALAKRFDLDFPVTFR